MKWNSVYSGLKYLKMKAMVVLWILLSISAAAWPIAINNGMKVNKNVGNTKSVHRDYEGNIKNNLY